jgi:hypothetical protein
MQRRSRELDLHNEAYNRLVCYISIQRSIDGLGKLKLIAVRRTLRPCVYYSSLLFLIFVIRGLLPLRSKSTL